MEFLAQALLGVIVKSSVKADLQVNHGINQPTYIRRCLGRDEMQRLECEKQLKLDQQTKEVSNETNENYSEE
jgi:hypothetical protein